MDFVTEENATEGLEQQGRDAGYFPTDVFEQAGAGLFRHAEQLTESIENARAEVGGGIASKGGYIREAPEPSIAPKELKAQFPDTKGLDEPMPLTVARNIANAQKRDERMRDAAERYPSGFLHEGAQLGLGVITGFLDPVDDAAFMVPVVGEARYGAMLARAGEAFGTAGRLGVTAATGAARGAAGGAIVSATGALTGADPDATLGSVAEDTLTTALMGGIFHPLPVVGAFRQDVLGERFFHEAFDEYMGTKRAAARVAAAQMAAWDPVEVRSLFGLRAYRESLMGEPARPYGGYPEAKPEAAAKTPEAGQRAPAATSAKALAEKSDQLDNAVARATGQPSQEEKRLEDEAERAKGAEAEDIFEGQLDEDKRQVDQARAAGALDAEDEAILKAADEDVAKATAKEEPPKPAQAPNVSVKESEVTPEQPKVIPIGATEPELPKPTQGWTEVGKNEAGQTLYEDSRGIRSYVEDGIRHTEPVGLRPTKSGMEISTDRDAHPQFRTAEEGGGKAPPKTEGLRPPAPPRPVERPATYGSQNKLVSKDTYERAKARMANKARTQLNAGLDPEMLQDGLTMAVYHLEAGARSFHAYAKAMLEDLGEWVRPYLKSFYESARHYPDFDATGMTPTEELTPEVIAAAGREEEQKIGGLADIRPPRENIDNVIDANFYHGYDVGPQMAPTASLKSGISEGDDRRRVTALAEKIASDGGYFERPIVDTEGNVIEGQHRVEAMRLLGAKEVPIHRIADTFAGIDMNGLLRAIDPDGEIHNEQARQVAVNAIEQLREAGSVEAALRDYELPRGWERQYRNAFDFLAKARGEPQSPQATPMLRFAERVAQMLPATGEMAAPAGWEKAEGGPAYHVDQFLGAPETGRIIAEGGASGRGLLYRALGHIEASANDPMFRELAGKLKFILNTTTVKLEAMKEGNRLNEEGHARIGLYNPNDEIIEIHLPSAYSPDQVLLHEAVHAATAWAITSDAPAGRQIKDIYEAYKKLASDKLLAPFTFGQTEREQYGFTNPYEFVAEFFSNPIFRTQLDTIRSRAEAESPSLFARILDAIKRFLGLDTTAPLQRILELQPELEKPGFLQRANAQGREGPAPDELGGFDHPIHAMLDPNAGQPDPYRDREKERASAAKKRQTTAYADQRKRLQMYAKVPGFLAQGATLSDFVDAQTRGINRAVRGARDSTAQQQIARQNDFAGRLMMNFDKIPGAMDAWTGSYATMWKPTMTKDWVRELSELNKKEGGKPGVTKNRLALDIAKAVHDAQTFAKFHLNRTGAWIGDYDGYVSRTMHDAVKIHQAGYVAWRDYALARLDQDRTFQDIMEDEDLDGMEPEDRIELFMQRMWDALSTGIHISSDHGVGMREAGFPASGTSLGRKLSAERVLHWKDADAWREYQERFGDPVIERGILNSLLRAGRDVALMERWGSNPRYSFERLISKLKAQYRNNHELVAELQKNENRLREEFAFLSGEALRPGNILAYKIGDMARAWQNITKLSFVVFTHMSVGATKPFQLKYSGMGRWQAYSSVLRNLVKDRSPEGRQILENLNANALGQVQNMIGGYEPTEGAPGAVAKLQMIAMRMGLLPWMMDRQKGGAMWELANFLGQRTGQSFDQLKPETQRALKIYNISPQDWDVLRQAANHDRDMDGQTYLTPKAAARADDAAIAQLAGDRYKMAKAKDRPRILAETRDNLAMRLASYYSDSADRSIITPGIPERARFSLIAGRTGGRFVGQYKTWAMAAVRQMWGQMRYGSSKAEAVKMLAELVAVGTAMGYARLAIRDALTGKEPEWFNDDMVHNGSLVMRSMLAGGGLGIFGDYLIGQFMSPARSVRDYADWLATTLGGPVLGDVGELFGIASETAAAPFSSQPANSFHEAAGAATRWLFDHIPIINAFYIRTIANWLILDRLQEMAQPGYWARYQAGVKARTGQSFWLEPKAYLGATNQQQQ